VSSSRSLEALPPLGRLLCAQQPAMPVIGFLHSGSPDAFASWVAAFRRGLNEASFIEGQNVAIEFRWAEGQLDRLPTLAADLVRRQVAVIVANNVSTPAAKATTSAIPIVFVSGGDPVRSGLVTSLSRPGGNVTGVSFTTGPLDAKRLQLLHDLVPKAATIGVLLAPSAVEIEAELRDVEEAGHALGQQIVVVKAGNESEFDAAFSTFVQSGVGALLVGAGIFFTIKRRQLAALATRHAIPTIYVARDYVEAGGLMSYGASPTDAYRRAGIYTGRILKGAKPGDLPVELPTKYELVINLATAKALGLEIPAMLLARADEVIE
jgi:putative ABC transport system substrate-binding protein